MTWPEPEGHEPRGPSSSLALMRRSTARCERVVGLQYYSSRSHPDVLFPASCGSNRCPVCGPRKAWKTALAVDRARPTRKIRFSLVGEEYKVRSRRVNEVASEMRGLGYEFEYWGVFERNPKGTGHHFHAWQRGDYIPQAKLQDVCEGHGMGIPDIRKWDPDRPGGGSAAYGLKGSSKYGLKADDVLDLNGGRYGTWSRNFFGMPYKQAMAEAVRAHYGAS
jgi:hypothetical protein